VPDPLPALLAAGFTPEEATNADLIRRQREEARRQVASWPQWKRDLAMMDARLRAAGGGQ
jgi:hypothetical protein